MSPTAPETSTARSRWVWVAAWAVLSLAAAAFSWSSHQQVSRGIEEAFIQQQGLGVRLIERMVLQQVNEAMLLLAGVKESIRDSAATGRVDFTSAAATIASRRIDQFLSLSVIAEDGRVLYSSQPSERGSPSRSPASRTATPRTP